MPQSILNKIHEPGFDINNLSQEEKIQLVRESDGLMIDILEGETICKSLNLMHCTSLTHLPNNLVVKENLYLHGCISITHLPSDLEVGLHLYVWDCTSLKEIPKTIKVGGHIYVPEHLK